MSGAAEAEDRITRPIFRVVSRFKTGHAEIGNLVVLVALKLRASEHQAIHLCGEVVVRARLRSTTDLVCERRAVVNFQKIKREVFGSKSERFIQIARPALESLRRKSGDEIEADVCESGLTQESKRAPDIVCGMRAAQSF